MEATSLRLGNAVEWLGDSPFIVSGLKDNGDITIKTVDNDSVNLTMGQSIKPIELTEEILLKCGFKKTPANNSYYLPITKLKAEVHFEIFRGELVCVLYCSTGSFIPNNIKYVHELQNLIHSLTGEELILNLT